MTLTPLIVTIIIGTVLPIVVGLVTKLNASTAVKRVALITVSSLQALIVSATLVDGSAFISGDTLLLAVLGWITAIASYFQVLKPQGVTGAIQEKTANIGVG